MNQEKKGLRRFLPLLCLAGVLLLAIAFVTLIIPAIQAKYPGETTTATTATTSATTLIAGADTETLTSITVSHLDGDSYTLLYQDDILSLVLDNGETESIKDSLTADIVKYATQVYILDVVAEDASDYADNLADMGLNPPQITVVSAFSDGSTVTISLGYGLADSLYYYYEWSGDDAIYLCDPGIYETFEYTADMLRTINQPAIDSTLVERVSILKSGEDAIVCTFETSADDLFSGTLQSPFIYPMDQDSTENLLTALDNFRLGARLEAATEEIRAEYGLTTPQVVVKIAQRAGTYAYTDTEGVLQTYTLDANTITLNIGDQNGEFFYYCEVDGICYRVSSFLISAFLNADAMNYVSLNPADLGEETLQSITVQTGGGTLNFYATYTENVLPNNELETDDSGNVVYTTTVTLNGEEITEDAFDELISRLQQITVSGKLDSAAEPEGTPRWQLTLTTVDGKTRTLAAYTMDSFSDILSVDGVALHYLSSEALDIALGDFATQLTPETNDTNE